jgi:predicted phosphate transport protein (TIGR00153 family)
VADSLVSPAEVRAARRRWSAFGAKPPGRELFSLLRSAGHNLVIAAETLDEMLRRWPESVELRQITDLEHEGDRLTHKVINRLRESKLAPFDREDIHALCGAIDDVVDDIEDASEQLALTKIEAPTDQAQQLAGVLRDCGRTLAAALDSLDRVEGLEDHFTEIRRLEQEGDRIYREALAALFDGAIDPMYVIRWKDIYTALEEAIDRCRTASNRLQGIVVKHT